MDTQIKRYADNGDLKSLKYIFVDSLDVDPTFVRYQEGYNYCASIPGLLETHKELTPFRRDSSSWDEDYWTALKMDLVKNFSDLRMNHMREVAKVFLAEKVERILAERAASSLPSPSTPPPSVEHRSRPEANLSNTSPSAAQEQRIAERRRKLAQLEENNRRAAEAEKADQERIAQKRQENQTYGQYSATGDSSKKAIGIALAVLAAVVVILVLVLKQGNP